MKTLMLLMLTTITFALDMGALVEHLKFEEGFRSTPYKCTSGYWTIGFGHRCSQNAKSISKEQAEKLLISDIAIARKNVTKLIKSDTPADVEFVLISMTFQLGYDGVLGFKNMLANIRKGTYKAAAEEMLRSKWKAQTPARAHRLAKRMSSIK